jgi:hypothetical protein
MAATAFFPPSSFFVREREVVNNNKDNQLRGDSVIPDDDYIENNSGLFGIYAPTINISAAGLRQKQKGQKQKYQQQFLNSAGV